jgi:hypothetical protein
VDVDLLREQLAQSERLVAEAEIQVICQRQIVGELAGSREHAMGARDLLRRYEEILESHVAERDALRRQLARLDANND